MEFTRGLEGGVDNRLRNAVPGHVKKADLLAGMPDVPRNGFECAGFPLKGRLEIDHGDRPRRFFDTPHRHGLEDIHRVDGTKTTPIEFDDSLLPLVPYRQVAVSAASLRSSPLCGTAVDDLDCGPGMVR